MTSPNTYSFVAVQAALVGPGGATQLGNSAGAAEEGITVAPLGEKNTMQIGADDSIMHSLHAANPGRITVRLLKTSGVNAVLSTIYNFQRSSPGNWGLNTITVSDTFRGDICTLSTAAFVGNPTLTYDKAGRFNEWVFDGRLIEQLGAGVPNVNTASGF